MSHSFHQLGPDSISMLSLNMGLHGKVRVDVRDAEIETALGLGETEFEVFGISREENNVSVCVSVYIYIDICSSINHLLCRNGNYYSHRSW